MRVSRVFVEKPAQLQHGATIELPDRAAHHVLNVLRLRAGATLVLFDGSGGEYDAVLRACHRRSVRVDVGAWRDLERESPLRFELAQAVSGAERMDFTIQKAVELGVTCIQPLLAERSVVRLGADRTDAKMLHWRRVIVAACEQSGRNRLPDLGEPRTVYDYCAGLTDQRARWLLAPDGAARLRDLAATDGVLAAGPEAGFSEDEVRRFRAAGFAAIRLGPRILRTETAAIAALGALNALIGDG